MLKRVLRKFRPTPTSAMTVSLLALVVALGSTGYAANGAAFVLGVINSATQLTTLGANYNGAALKVGNTSTGAAATPLLLTAAAGHPPMKVNTVIKVVNLNADYIDGIDSTGLTKLHNTFYSLLPGQTSAPIALPPGRLTQLIASNLTPGDEGLGQASLIEIANTWIQWVGLNSFGTAVTRGIAQSATAIITIDYLGKVVVEIVGPTTIRVHNTNTVAESGTISLMW